MKALKTLKIPPNGIVAFLEMYNVPEKNHFADIIHQQLEGNPKSQCHGCDKYSCHISEILSKKLVWPNSSLKKSMAAQLNVHSAKFHVMHILEEELKVPIRLCSIAHRDWQDFGMKVATNW